MIYLLGKKVGEGKVAVASAWLAALSPPLIWYSQEARSYSCLVFMGLAVMLTAANLLRQPSVVRSLFFIITMTAAVYTHYGAFLLVPLQLVLLVYLRARNIAPRNRIAWWLVSWVAVMAVYIPWMRSPAARSFFNSLKTGSYPVQYAAEKIRIDARLLMAAILIIAAIALILCLWLIYRFFSQRSNFWDDLRSNSALQGLFLTAFIGLLIISVFPRAYSVKKQLLVLWPYILLFFAWIWPWEQKRKAILAFVLALSLISSLINIFFIPKDEWRQAVAYIHSQSEKGDLVLLLPAYMTFPFDYYDKENSERIGIQPSDLPLKLEPTLRSIRRIWLVANRPYLLDPEGKIKKWLDTSAKFLTEKNFYLVETYLYQTK